VPSPTCLKSIPGNVNEDRDDDDLGDVNLAGVVTTLLLVSGGNVAATTLRDSDGIHADSRPQYPWRYSGGNLHMPLVLNPRDGHRVVKEKRSFSVLDGLSRCSHNLIMDGVLIAVAVLLRLWAGTELMEQLWDGTQLGTAATMQ
jgi:hypothetical protein